MPLDERDLYNEREERKPATLACPHCHDTHEYDLNWLVRTKKAQLPRGADDRDRARFAKARNYMVRREDAVMCKNERCRKRFEVSGVQSVAFQDEEAAALAQKDLAANPAAPPSNPAPRVPRGFGRPTNRAGFADSKDKGN